MCCRLVSVRLQRVKLPWLRVWDRNVPCTTVNKVCASGMKSIALASQAILCGDADLVVAGGMENMSQVPHYLNGRNGVKFGNIKVQDGMLLDGLTDVYNATHMGNCAELCAKEKGISSEEQDAFAIESYKRATEAWETGKFASEVVSCVGSTETGRRFGGGLR